jgi:hypothetical protein
MDPDNFTDEKIDGYFAQMVNYICKLYEKTLEDKGNLKKAAVVTAVNMDTDTDTDTEDEGIGKDIVQTEKQQNSGMVNDHMVSLFKQMQDNNRNSTEDENVDPDKTAREFRGRIERMVQDYRLHCSLMQMENLMNEYGNENYRKEKMKEENELTYRLTEIRDPGYTSKFFDVLTWWRVEGTIKFKELSIAANIFLGKPTHNGFQERVFSRGVYLDGKLKKRLKEENFEMSVLNSFNEQRVSTIKEALQSKDNKEYTGWMSEKQTKESQAKELLQFYKKDKFMAKMEKEYNDSSDDDGEDDGSVNSRNSSDDDSLGDFLKSKNFLGDEYTPTKINHATTSNMRSSTKSSVTSSTFVSVPETEIVEL